MARALRDACGRGHGSLDQGHPVSACGATRPAAERPSSRQPLAGAHGADGVLDYGIGNLRSAQKALQHLGADARLTADPA